MFTENFLEKYPNTVSFIKDKIKEKTLKALRESGVDSESIDMFVGIAIDDSTIAGSLKSSPGNMLNILDEVGVHFYVYPLRDEDTNVVRYLYDNINETPPPNASVMYFPNRIEAEYWAVMEAFKMSEAMLRQVKT